MARSTVDNTAFDAALAAVPAPYGPLTRTGTVPLTTLATPAISPNSHLRYNVKTATGLTVAISYEEVTNATLRNDILKEAHGVNGVLNELKDFINILDAWFDDINALTVNKEAYSAVMRLFSFMVKLINTMPQAAWIESQPSEPAVASFSVAGTGATRTYVDTSTGRVLFRLWTFDNGNFSTSATPPAQTYAVDGTYAVRLIVVGQNGISSVTTNVVVDVP